ncbi:hypothetical protein BDI4_540007 [Burkholderia diffusa]|nr:hypothetical protein BDI4_540007 [Burkholderia diffusa]
MPPYVFAGKLDLRAVSHVFNGLSPFIELMSGSAEARKCGIFGGNMHRFLAFTVMIGKVYQFLNIA